MSDGAAELYQELILDHYRRPRNRGRILGGPQEPGEVRTAELANPLCGDEVALTVLLSDGRVADCRFEGVGCAISMASASMLTERVKGLAAAEAVDLAAKVRALARGEGGGDDGGEPDGAAAPERLGPLAALAGVARFPVRVRCALLAWDALERALYAKSSSSV
jgi:nitrogen fixation NifU-like protein